MPLSHFTTGPVVIIIVDNYFKRLVSNLRPRDLSLTVQQ